MHLEARNPVREARASGAPWQFAEPWDGMEYFDSVQRTRTLWEPNLPGSGRRPLFVHLGIFMDKYGVGERASQWLVMLSLMGVATGVGNRHSIHQPVAVFREEGQRFELGCVFKRLRDDLEALAAGIDFTGSMGRQYRIFPVVSHVIADIAAVREGLCLKISSTCNYPCVFCDARRRHRSILVDGRCSFNCGNDPSYNLKTAEMYQQAFTSPQDAPVCMALSEDPRVEATRFSLLRGLPGLSIPEGVSIDLMHTEFLGECQKHASHFLPSLLRASGLSEAVFCSRISHAFTKILQLNRISAKSSF